MSSKPKIAVTCSFDEDSGYHKIHRGYIEAVADSGGTPYVLGHNLRGELSAEEIIGEIDGILFSGGGDLDPVHYDQEPRYEFYTMVPERDSLELKLARQCLKKDLPVLGLCRGIQVINLAAGGGLIQDIENQVDDPLQHSQDAPRWHPIHEIDINSDSLLEDVLDRKSIRVNSFHHQSLAEIADELEVSATASDGVIEAIESKEGGSQLGVQWHPERMWKKHPVHKELFKWLVEESKT